MALGKCCAFRLRTLAQSVSAAAIRDCRLLTALSAPGALGTPGAAGAPGALRCAECAGQDISFR